MEKPTLLFRLLLIVLLSNTYLIPLSASACMHYTGFFPTSSTHLPFEALIIDNDIPVCWISRSLSEQRILHGVWREGVGRGGWLSDVRGEERVVGGAVETSMSTGTASAGGVVEAEGKETLKSTATSTLKSTTSSEILAEREDKGKGKDDAKDKGGDGNKESRDEKDEISKENEGKGKEEPTAKHSKRKTISKRSGWDRISLTGMDPLRSSPSKWNSKAVQHSIGDWYLPSPFDDVKKFPETRIHLFAPPPPVSSSPSSEETETESEKEREREGGKNLTEEEREKERERKAVIGEGVDDWLEWRMNCLEGYYAHVMVGFRGVVFRAHGQEFVFAVRETEEFGWEGGELGRFVYEMDLWCDSENGNG